MKIAKSVTDSTTSDPRLIRHCKYYIAVVLLFFFSFRLAAFSVALRAAATFKSV
jgi:hypothetical protein